MTKYFCNGLSLIDFCNRDLKKCKSLRSFIKRNNGEVTEEQIIEFLKRREIRIKNKRISQIINSLNISIINDEVLSYLNELKINTRQVKNLLRYKIELREIIIYTWYYYDKFNSKDEKIISIKSLKKHKERITNYCYDDIKDYIIAIKLEYKNSFNDFFEYERAYLISLIKNILSKYKIETNYFNINDILSECYIYLKQVVDRIVLENNASLAKYINSCMRGHIYDYINDKYINEFEVSLEEHDINNIYNHSYIYEPLNIVIKKENLDILSKSISIMNNEDLKIINSLYFQEETNYSIWDLLFNDIDGYEIHDSIGRFKDTFLRLYYKEELE